eukprot:sb/3478160/
MHVRITSHPHSFGGRSTSRSDHIGGSDPPQPRIRSHYWNLIHPIPHPQGSDHILCTLLHGRRKIRSHNPRGRRETARKNMETYPLICDRYERPTFASILNKSG